MPRFSGTVESSHELHARLLQQEAVARLGQLALAEPPLDELLAAASEAVALGLRAELASVLERLPDGAFIVRSAVGWPPGLVGREVVPGGARSQSGSTLEVGGPVVVDDSAAETRFELSPQTLAQGVTSGISAPIGANGGTFGVLSAHTRARRVFTSHDVAFLEAVAYVLSSSIRRRRAEAETERTHRLLEAVVEGTTDAVFVKDLEGRFLVVNEAAAGDLGHPREEIVGSTLPDLLGAPEADPLVVSDRLVAEHGIVETFEESLVTAAGPKTVLTTKGPYRDSDGAVIGTFGIARDITDRKLHEQQLRAARDYADQLVETSNALVVVLDVDGNVVTFNRAAEEVSGYRRDEMIGRPWTRFVHEDQLPELRAAFDRLLRDGSPESYESPIVTRAGEKRLILWRNSRLFGPDGATVGTVSFGIDVTEAAAAEQRALELEERLRQAEKLESLGQLAGGIAHDFNNVLLAIRGYGEQALAAFETHAADPATEIEALLAAADHAAGLTRQLLAFARRQVLNPEVVDLDDVVPETAALLARMLGEGITLAVDLAAEQLPVRADRDQLAQVITNLAINARDAMPGGGTVTITTFGADGRACLSVADTGSGIDPEVVPRIFEPFFTTKGELGNGLGLATVYGIVAQSGGEVTVETALGEGTTFTISLPTAPAGELPRDAPEPQPGAAHEGSERILLVEDDPVGRAVVSEMLAAHGFQVVAAESGAAAVEAFAESHGRIDLLLTDLAMQGLDGRETAGRIRSVAPATKVLYMSGSAPEAAIRSGPLAAGTAFIQKPFSGDDLASRVRGLLDAAA